jgi:LmbE family N-acetylglucosaminyl deacetylase
MWTEVLRAVYGLVRTSTPEMDEPKAILALGAHPDDLELGCGATLAKLVELGATVCAVIFSDGSRGGPPGVDRGD